MFTILPALLQAAAPAAVPLQPHGKWTVAYEESMCLASRTFGPAGDISLILRPSPLNEMLEIMVLRPGPERHAVINASATVSTQKANPVKVEYMAFRRPSGERAISLYTDQTILDELGDDAVLQIRTARDGSMAFAMRHVSRLKPVIADCKKAVAKRWGVDPAELEMIGNSAEAIGERARWITQDDYAPDALRKGLSGTSIILWKIGLDGRAADCKVVSTSGSDSLDRVSCSAILKRARYRPAKDKAGRAMVSHDMRRVNWIIPRT